MTETSSLPTPCPECGARERLLQPKERPNVQSDDSMAGKFYSSTPAMAGDGDIIAGLIGAVFDLFDLIFRLFKPRRKPAPQ